MKPRPLRSHCDRLDSKKKLRQENHPFIVRNITTKIPCCRFKTLQQEQEAKKLKGWGKKYPSSMCGGMKPKTSQMSPKNQIYENQMTILDSG
jgi:hypothetical protein